MDLVDHLDVNKNTTTTTTTTLQIGDGYSTASMLSADVLKCVHKPVHDVTS